MYVVLYGSISVSRSYSKKSRVGKKYAVWILREAGSYSKKPRVGKKYAVLILREAGFYMNRLDYYTRIISSY